MRFNTLFLSILMKEKIENLMQLILINKNYVEYYQ